MDAEFLQLAGNGPRRDGGAQSGKTIYLIRHAESVNNVSKRTCKACCPALFCGCKFPSCADLLSVAGMLTCPMNTPLSEEGRAQVSRQRQKVIECCGFDSSAHAQPQLLVHSPLMRARDTCEGLFGGRSADLNTVQHLEIYERDRCETCSCKDIASRIAHFETWLLARTESRIVVVGHSRFFREMLGIDGGMANVSVWRTTLHANRTWTDVTMVEAGCGGADTA
jgi:broad specificity phosphatase PhoE